MPSVCTAGGSGNVPEPMDFRTARPSWLMLARRVASCSSQR